MQCRGVKLFVFLHKVNECDIRSRKEATSNDPQMTTLYVG